MKLKTKIWLLLGTLVGLVLVIDLTITYRKLTAEMRLEAEYDARTIYGFMMATRRIYQEQFVASGLPVNDKTVGFLPAHSISRISRDFANWNSSGIVFNNVSDRPRNPNNQADRFELEAMAWFRANPNAEERVLDIVDDKGTGYLLYAAPIWIEPFCLKCHADAADAPPSIRDTYSTAYGYKIGDLRGVASIKMPTAKFDQRLDEVFGIQIIKSLTGYALLFFGLGWLLDRLVTQRLARLHAGAERIAAGEYDARVAVDGRDEIAHLAKTFNRMGEGLERHRNHLEELVAERTDELTVARNEAERLAYAKSEFLANMSHELRTPLNGVLGLARMGVRDNVGRSSYETFVRIQDSGAHLLGVINDILDFSKLDAGKLVVEQRPFVLANAIANALSFVSHAAQQKGLALEMSTAADLPEWVTGDAQRLQQILVNLLSNAVKFTERGEVRLRVACEGDETYFKVIDTGIGLAEEQIARLFQAFEQGDSSTTRKYGGTGLGLAISRNLARLMGGEITIEGAAGVGCCFTLRLPLPQAEPDLLAPDVASFATAERPLAGLCLLAAEDVAINRLILEDLLDHEGAQVIFAENGQQVLDRLEEAGVSKFDAVLMDVQMPVMNGLEATRRLREIAPALPVIGLTAHALVEERDKCLAAGMVEHVTKPIDTALLVAAILRHTQGRAPTTAPAAVPAPVGTALDDWPALATITGIDLARGLAMMRGNATKYVRLLTMFADSHDQDVAQLNQCLAANDIATVKSLAHTLKGTAGNLGATTVQASATALDVAILQQADADEIQRLASCLRTDLAALIEAIRALPESDDGQRKGAVPPAPTSTAAPSA